MSQCFAFDCNHRAMHDTCHFFRFPKDKIQFNVWRNVCRRADNEPKNYSRLCSCHFVNGLKENGPTIFTVQSPRKTKKKKRLFIDSSESNPTVEPSKVVPEFAEPISYSNSLKRKVELSSQCPISNVVRKVKNRLSEVKSPSNLTTKPECTAPLSKTELQRRIEFLMQMELNFQSPEKKKNMKRLSEDSSEPHLTEEVVSKLKKKMELSFQSPEKIKGSNLLGDCRESKSAERQSAVVSKATEPLLNSELQERVELQNRVKLLESELALMQSTLALHKSKHKTLPGNVLTYPSLEKNSDFFHYYTGLPNYDYFDILTEWLSDQTLSYKDNWTPRNISLKDQLLLTLIKLRLNLDFTDLSARFQIHRSSVRNIFLTLIYALREILVPLIKMPSEVPFGRMKSYKILKSFPPNLKEHFTVIFQVVAFLINIHNPQANTETNNDDDDQTIIVVWSEN